MRTTMLILLLSLFTIGAFAQKRSDLKGPAYKNYKPGQHISEPTLVYTVTNKKELKGPAYKNKKPWQDKSDKKYVAITYGSDRSKLKGPAYKNYKPWRKNNN